MYRQSGKNLLNSNTSSTCPDNMVNVGLLTAEIRWRVRFQRVSRHCNVTARHSSSGRQPSFAALNRGCHLYSAGRPSRWALVHISSVNIECRSEMCCTRLAENTGRKNVAKNRHLRTIAQLCRAISAQSRHVSTIGKKLVKLQYLLHMSSQYGATSAH